MYSYCIIKIISIICIIEKQNQQILDSNDLQTVFWGNKCKASILLHSPTNPQKVWFVCSQVLLVVRDRLKGTGQQLEKAVAREVCALQMAQGQEDCENKYPGKLLLPSFSLAGAIIRQPRSEKSQIPSVDLELGGEGWEVAGEGQVHGILTRCCCTCLQSQLPGILRWEEAQAQESRASPGNMVRTYLTH